MTSSARYTAVSESTADDVTDDDEKDYDDDDGCRDAANSSYESFSRCDLMLTDADDDTTSARSHRRNGTAASLFTARCYA